MRGAPREHVDGADCVAGKQNSSTAPVAAALRPDGKALHDRDGDAPLAAPRESHELLGARPRHFARGIIALGEQRRLARAQLEQDARRRELQPSIPPALPPLRERPGGIARKAFRDGLERRGARGEVDGPTIVGIDEAEVPELAALVDVGHAGRRELERQLHETVVRAEPRNSACERRDPRQQLVVRPGVERRVD